MTVTTDTTARPGIGVLELANAALRRWRLIVGVPALFAVLGVVLALLLPRWYAASAAFVPEARKTALPAAVAGIVGQLGMGFGDQGQSPQFYADVVQTREIVEQVLGERYPLSPGHAAGDSVRLLDFLDVTGDDERQRIEKGVKKLRSHLMVTVNPRTSIVRLRLELRDPVAVAAVTNRFLEALNTFNQRTRRSQAGARRVFVEQRIQDAERELREAENALQGWLMRNRSYQGYPSLEFEHERLERQVQLRRDTYQSLFRQYDEARIEEVNDTPVLTVVEHAVPPARKSRPRRAAFVLVMTALGVLVGVLAALLAEYAARLPVSDATGYAEFRRLSGALRDDLWRKRR